MSTRLSVLKSNTEVRMSTPDSSVSVFSTTTIYWTTFCGELQPFTRPPRQPYRPTRSSPVTPEPCSPAQQLVGARDLSLTPSPLEITKLLTPNTKRKCAECFANLPNSIDDDWMLIAVWALVNCRERDAITRPPIWLNRPNKTAFPVFLIRTHRRPPSRISWAANCSEVPSHRPSHLSRCLTRPARQPTPNWELPLASLACQQASLCVKSTIDHLRKNRMNDSENE